MALTDAALVFLKCDIELPMQTVLDTPVATHRVGEAARRDELAEDVVADFADVLAVAQRLAEGNPNCLQTRPTRTVWQVIGNGTDDVVPTLLSAVPLFLGVVITHADAREVVLRRVSK